MNDTVPAIRGDDHAAIEGWLERLWAEHGLSDRTLSAYRSDLGGFARWQASRDSSLDAADREALERYLASRKVSARSNARLLSALRRYFADRVRRQPGSADPTVLLVPPKLPRSLPKALSETQVEALLQAPDVGNPLGLRDRSMFELMYACGLRVSELVDLPLSALNPRQGVLRLTGKGGKQRLVPIGEEARDWLGRNGFDPLMGARPMARLIQDKIKRPLADELLFGKLMAGGRVGLEVLDGELRLDVQAEPEKLLPAVVE